MLGYNFQVPLLETYTQINFTKGVDDTVPILDQLDSTLSIFTLSSNVQHAYVSLFNAHDGRQERIVLGEAFSHPSLSFGETSRSSSQEEESQLVYFWGTATGDVYLNALRSLRYVNERGSPTTGVRQVVIVVSDGESINSFSETAVNLIVDISNTVPSVFVGSGSGSYVGTFFPDKGPVPVVNFSLARVEDPDSPAIYQVTMEIANPLNRGEENLTVTYVSPDRLSLPVVVEATPLLDVPFGNLSFRSELVPTITSTIVAGEVGVVGGVVVTMDIRHSWVGDLKIELEHAGRIQTLVQSPGGKLCASDDLFQTTFDVATPSNISLSQSAISPGLCRFQSQGVFRPDGDLATFRGDPIEGEWHLRITDLILRNDNGRLVTWGLIIQPEESHAFFPHPPVVPPLVVSAGNSLQDQYHIKEISEQGRISQISVQVHLGVASTATTPYLPQITLRHPDGTSVLLTNASIPLCALGNFTYVVFDDRAQGRTYTCQEAVERSQLGSSTDSNDPVSWVTYDDIVRMNISIPLKNNTIDILRPQALLASLIGKAMTGKWTLHLSTPHHLPSTLLGWSLRVAMEPNIDAVFDYSSDSLNLRGVDSAEAYGRILRSVVYGNVAFMPDFSAVRQITTTAFDGEGYSLGIYPQDSSYITVHHLDLDLDPRNISGSGSPGFRVTFQEHGFPVPILDPDNAVLSDASFSSGQYTLTVRLLGYRNQNEERLEWNGDVSPQLINQTIIDDSSELFEVILTSAPGDLQPISYFQDILRTFEYVNEAEEFVGVARRVEVFATDSQMSSNYVSVVALSNITLEATNDVPVLLLNSYSFSETDIFSNMVEFTEGEGPVFLANDTAIVLTDNDHAFLSSLTIVLLNPQDGRNELLIADVLGTSIEQTYNELDHTLSLAGLDSLANYTSVIATIAYDNNVHSPGRPGTTPRMITFLPFDGTHYGREVTVQVSFTAVNDPSMADLNGPLPGTDSMATFVEEGPPVAVFPNVTFFDIDNTSLSYIEVQIVNVVNTPLEILQVLDVVQRTDPSQKVVTVTNLRPQTDYDYDTGTLMVSGLDYISEYELVLRTLTYSNLADEPNDSMRLISVILNDGLVSSSPVFASVQVELVNDSPFFISPSSSAITVSLREDVPALSNSGIEVADLVRVLSDDDQNATIGIVVVSLDPRNGIWEYSLDSGLVWNEIQTNVSREFGLALDLLASVRFDPHRNFHGVASFTFVGWDQTDGSQTGSYIDARSGSDTDAFTPDSRRVNMEVAAVNDAPVLLNVPFNGTVILEDNRDSVGDTIASLLIYAYDIDDPSQLGITITDADQENGLWQFTNDGGVVWEEFGNISETSALLLWSQPASLRRVRFIPDLDFNGQSSFQFLAWDLTTPPQESSQMAMGGIQVSVAISSGSGSGFNSSGSGQGSGDGSATSSSGLASNVLSANYTYPSGTRFINASMSDPVTGPFSVNSSSLTVVVEPVNDSPVLSMPIELSGIVEDLRLQLNHGYPLSSILTSSIYTDVDDGAERGVAVVGVANRGGRWQYNCGEWEEFVGDIIDNVTIPRVSAERATLLSSSCSVRFIPEPNFNTEWDLMNQPRPASDTPFLLVRGWDNTGNTAGLVGRYGMDTSAASLSGINEFSSASVRISLTVISINDKPELFLTSLSMASYEGTFLEDLHPVPAVGKNLTLRDVDHKFLRDVTVTISGSMFDTYSNIGNIDFNATLPPETSLPGSGSGSSSGSGSGSGLNFTATLEPPTDTLMTTTGTGISSVSSSVPSLDHIRAFVRNLSSPSYEDRYCSGMEQRREELFFSSNLNLDLQSEVLSYCPFVLRIFPDPAISDTADKNLFQQALRFLLYNNSLEEPHQGLRTLTFEVSDGESLSTPVQSLIYVQRINDRPLLDLDVNAPDLNNYVTFVEGQGPILLANASVVGLRDNDDQYLQSATVTILSAPDADHEVLNASTNGTDILVEYDNVTFTLYLTGNASIEDYHTILSSVTYENLYSHPGRPDERERQVSFVVSDETNSSSPAVAFVAFDGVNDRPQVDLNGNAAGVNFWTVYLEEMTPVRVVADTAFIHDEDNSSLGFVTVTITNPYSDEVLAIQSEGVVEVLERSQYGEDKVVRITNLMPNMTYNQGTGTLTITGLDSVEEYQLVLRMVTYEITRDEPPVECRELRVRANDGDLNSTDVISIICIEPVNDSPRNNETVLDVATPLVLEDDPDPVGISVFELAFYLFRDDDQPPPRHGIAIIGAEFDGGKGQWQYSLDGRATWLNVFPNTTIHRALLLSAEETDRNYVRFFPAANFNGNTSIDFVGWDASDNVPPGTIRSAVSKNDTDPFSEDMRRMVGVVVPVNDAPVVNISMLPRLSDILEDDVVERDSVGDSVEDVFLTALSHDVDVSDLDEHEFGIAVTGTDSSNGFWQYSVNGGFNWTDFGAVSPSSAVVLRSRPAGSNRIRFVPSMDYNGDSTIIFKIWDQNTTWTSGYRPVDAELDPVTGTFSRDSATARVRVDPVNDSPVLVRNSRLTPISEGSTSNTIRGTDVSSILINAGFSDIDGMGMGVAVLYVDKRNGDWQYTCDSGVNVNWMTFVGERISFYSIFGNTSQLAPISPNEFRATLLGGNCRIRFIPNTLFNTFYTLSGAPRSPDDRPFITIRAWDMTSGRVLQEGVDTTSNPDDHTNAFSREIVNAYINVTSSSNSPVLYLSGDSMTYAATFVEPIPPDRTVIPVPIVNVSSMRLVDLDNTSLARADIFFSSDSLLTSGEGISVSTAGTSLNFTTSTDSASNRYTLTLVPTNGISAPLTDFETAIRTLRYYNPAEEPSTLPRVIRFLISDGVVVSPFSATTIYVELVNDPPQFDLGGSMPWPQSYSLVSYSESEGQAYIIGPDSTLVDFDNQTVQSARLAILSPPNLGSEILSVSSNMSGFSITSLNNGSELEIFGEATTNEYLDVLRNVTYEHLLSNPSSEPRRISVVVSDGTNDSIPAIINLFFTPLNNMPVLDVNGNQTGTNFTTTFREELGPVAAVSPLLVLEDIDNSTLAYVNVTILNPVDGNFELLYVEDVTETDAPLDEKHVTFWNFRPTQLYDAESGTLHITGLESVYEYQEVLKTLKYDNRADEPNPVTRAVRFEVSDGLLLQDNVYSFINIENINDSPFFNVSAVLFSPSILEDVHNFDNPGWSVRDIVGSDLILDDDAEARQGIAVIEADFANGHWEVTWDYTTDFDFSGSGSGNGSGSGTGMEIDTESTMSGSGMQNDSESESGNGTFTEGFDVESGTDSPANETGSGDFGSASLSGSGSFNFSLESGSGSGMSGSGMNTNEPSVKCVLTTPTAPPTPMQTFSATWYRLSNRTSSVMATVLRANGARTRIRFVPSRDYEGSTTFSFKAWDLTDEILDGKIVDTTSTSTTDAYSSAHVTITVAIDMVNDSPFFTGPMTFNLTNIVEDDRLSEGDEVRDLVVGVADVDIQDRLFGIAVVRADEENGVWEFSLDGGASWTAMIRVCPNNATVLSPNLGTRIRFSPYVNFNGDASISFLAWDHTSDHYSGQMSVDTTTSHPVTGTFSTSAALAMVTVLPDNDSPVLTQGPMLDPIYEDIPISENTGTSVTEIVRGYFYDVDVNSEVGVAVIGVDPTHGVWEWNCPGSSSGWNEFVGDVAYGIRVLRYPRADRATLLLGSCRIRFLPDMHYNTELDVTGNGRHRSEIPYIRILGWDNTGETRGGVGRYAVDTTRNNDSVTNEFSAHAQNAYIEVASVNDQVRVVVSSEGDGQVFRGQFIEEVDLVRIVDPPSVAIVDLDHATLVSVSAILMETFDPGMEMILLANSSNVRIDINSMTAIVMTTNPEGMSREEHVQIVVNFFSAQSQEPTSLALTTPPGMPQASVEAYQVLLSLVSYANSHPEPNNATRRFQFLIDDGTYVNNLTRAELQVELLNDNAPVLADSLALVDFVEEEGDSVAIVSPALSLTDADHNLYFLIVNATLRLYNPYPEESLAVDLDVVSSTGMLSQSYDQDSGVLVIAGGASVSDYEMILRTANYSNIAEEPRPGSRVVEIRVHDGLQPSNLQIVVINVILVNDQPPVVTISSAPFVFTERLHPISIGENLTVTDDDSGRFLQEWVNITIINALDDDAELLTVTTFGNVSSTYTVGNGQNVLTLTGPATLEDFLATLATLSYGNSAEEPSPEDRVVEVVAYDGDFFSQPEQIIIEITLINDPPVISILLDDIIVNYVEGDGPAKISEGISLSDNDHTYLEMARVVILDLLDAPNEILSVALPNDSNITSDYDNSTGVLTLEGLETLLSYQAALQNLTYEHLEADPGFPDTSPRRIQVNVFDGLDFSADVTLILTFDSVNDPPMVDLNGPDVAGANFTVHFVEEGSPVFLISPDAFILDIDNATLTYLTVTIENRLDGSNEVLALNETTTTNSSSFAYDNSTGTLTVRNLETLDDFVDALLSVTYVNLADEPNFTPRIISFVASDGLLQSTAQYTTVEITPVNDPPRLYIDLGGGGADETTEFPTMAGSGSGMGSSSGSGSGSGSTTFGSGDQSSIGSGMPASGLGMSGSGSGMSGSGSGMSGSGMSSSGLGTSGSGSGIESASGMGSGSDFGSSSTASPDIGSGIASGSASGMGSSSGLGSASGSGSGMGSAVGSGSGVGSGSEFSSGMLMDLVSGSASGSALGSGSGIQPPGSATPTTPTSIATDMPTSIPTDMPTTSPTIVPLLPIPTDPPLVAVDPCAGLQLNSDADYATCFAENSSPIRLTSSTRTVVEDDDDATLSRLEIQLSGHRDAGREAIFFHIGVLSLRLTDEILLAGGLMYLGSEETCTSRNMPDPQLQTAIDLSRSLNLTDWTDILKSLRYCNSDRNLTNGTRSVSFRIQDPSGAWSNSQEASIEVFGVNDRPVCDAVLSQNIATIMEDSSLTISVLGSCRDNDNILTASSIRVAFPPSIGEVTVNPETGDITYVSAQDDHGMRRFSYQACDSLGACSLQQVVNVIINPVNDPPYAVSDLVLYIQEDQQTSVPLTAYFGDVEDDLDPNNRFPRVQSYTGGLQGDITIASDLNSTLTYRPLPDFDRSDVINLVVCDSQNVCISVSIQVIVRAVNDPPIITILYPGGGTSFLTDEDTPTTLQIVVRDTEDRNYVNISVVSVLNGTASPDTTTLATSTELNSDGTEVFVQSMSISYTPNRNFYGDDIVVIKATDSEGNSTLADIRVTVHYINDPPMFGITDITITEDTPTLWELPSALGITDPDDVLNAGSFMILEPPTLGNLVYQFNRSLYEQTGRFPPTGTLSYIPPPHYFTNNTEPITFIIQACDNNTVTMPLCANATFRLFIESDNDPPVLPTIQMSLYEDAILTFDLWNFTTDVEEGQPPVQNVELIPPLPTLGVASYDNQTGYLSYEPYPNVFGVDHVYYNACDSTGRCSQERGVVTLTILEVNDQPEAMDVLHIAREDDFDLIAFYRNISDNETTNLRIEIVNDTDGSYVDMWTTPIGGSLRVYHAHQIITYLPPPNFVGEDFFRYSVCDTCDPRRDRELGRVRADANCLRQIEENNGTIVGENEVYVTCAEANVTVAVANINDVPVIRDVSGVTMVGEALTFALFDDAVVDSNDPSSYETISRYLYRNSTSAIYEPDDEQVYSAFINNLNFSLYNLQNHTDIDENSLRITTEPTNGLARLTATGNRTRVMYIPQGGFSGYDAFNFEVCDQFSVGMGTRCTEGTARVWVTKAGPSIVSVVATGALDGVAEFTDSKVGNGDRYLVTFSEATSMPPYGTVGTLLSKEEVDNVLVFGDPFFLDEVSTSAYIGKWLNDTTFEIEVVNEGYPVPFRARVSNGMTSYSSIMIGEWTLAVSPNRGPCGGFDIDNQPLTILDRFCLTNAARTSHASVSTSPALSGNYGLKLPNISNVIVRNVAVDDSKIADSLDSKLIYERSQLAIMLQPPFSYDQLATYCEYEAAQILSPSAIGTGVSLIVVGCANLLSNGMNADLVYENNVKTMEQRFLINDNARRRREAAEEGEGTVHSRVKRQAVQPLTSYPVPVASEIVLQINSLQTTRVDPAQNPTAFVQEIDKGYNFDTVIEVISRTSGVPASALLAYLTRTSSTEALNTFFYYEFDPDITPQITRVEAADPFNANPSYGNGDTITIYFSVSTNQPDVSTKAAIDLIFVFEPSLGNNYRGDWLSPSSLRITILDAGLGGNAVRPSTDPVNFGLTFRPNYFHTGDEVTANNTILPTTTPECIGINVCSMSTTDGSQPQTIGICSANGLSCRAHQGWMDLVGTFGDDGSAPSPPVFPWWWIVVAVVVVVLIVILVVVFYFIYRYYKQKSQRKEALRVVKRWKKDQFAPGKEAEKKDSTAGQWVKPPDVATMRDNPDPFTTPLKKLPEVVPRPPTAIIEAENLPPVPQQPFKPRALPQIRPSVLSPIPSEPTSPMNAFPSRPKGRLSLPALSPGATSLGTLGITAATPGLGLPKLGSPVAPAPGLPKPLPGIGSRVSMASLSSKQRSQVSLPPMPSQRPSVSSLESVPAAAPPTRRLTVGNLPSSLVSLRVRMLCVCVCVQPAEVWL